jgi:two-component system, cell cycle response regulator DivK
MLVLVADDDPGTCDLVTAVARKGGHTAIIARDAMQVMLMATRHAPDAIVLDLRMPGGTGIGALQKLKMSTKTTLIPVIVVSGVTDPEVIEHVLGMGAQEYLVKPIHVGDLTNALARLAQENAAR